MDESLLSGLLFVDGKSLKKLDYLDDELSSQDTTFTYDLKLLEDPDDEYYLYYLPLYT